MAFKPQTASEAAALGWRRRLVSLGPGAAETCGDERPPTVGSLAASPVLRTALFMFLSVNNNLKQRSLLAGNAAV